MLSIVKSKKEFIFENDRDFESCHASTLVRMEDGNILAAWFGGSWESNPDTAIWAALRTDSGWQRPYVAADRWCVPHWNPSLFCRKDGIVLLFYKEGKNTAEWISMVKYSDDGGKSFSSPRQLFLREGLDRGPVKNKCILLSDGRIAAPGSVEPAGVDIWDSFVDFSSDGGKTWEMGPFIPVRRVDTSSPRYRIIRHSAYDKKRCLGKGIIQPAIWESQPGHIHALMRSSSSAIFRSDSTDGGETWNCAYNTGLPNNNSGIDLVKLDGGELLLVSNPVGIDWGARTPLTVSCSCDNGISWEEIFVLEDESGEYSYPAIVSYGREVFISYTWRRERIAYWHLELSP